MTSMEQIEIISVEARKHGMKYGEYVEKYGSNLPKPEPEKKKGTGYIEGGRRGHRPLTQCICTMCGVPFFAGRKGAKYCPECTLKRRSECSREYVRRKKKKEEG